MPRAKKKIVKETVFDDDPPLPAIIPESPLVQDLSEADKQEFARLLKEKMTLTQRADMLVKLASFSDTKRAPVALRAIQEINTITGVKDDKPNEAAPLFQLPPGTAVAIKVFEPTDE